MVCGTLCLDHSGAAILSRVGNAVYEACRQGKVQLSGFPDFSPLVSALKAGNTPQRTKAYRVTAEAGGKLVVLESFAKRWMEVAGTKERAEAAIREHNEYFNIDGEFWACDPSETASHVVVFCTVLKRLANDLPALIAGLQAVQQLMSKWLPPGRSSWRRFLQRRLPSCPMGFPVLFIEGLIHFRTS